MTPQTVDPINWPVVELAGQRLVVRWTFFVQWLLSSRKVSVVALPEMMKNRDPGLVALMMECFAAAVAQNFTAQGLPAPTPEHWAMVISQSGPEVWAEVNRVIWEAVKKAPRAATPTPETTPAILDTGTRAN